MKVSIIVPAYNEEGGIKAVIEKLKKLKIKNKEILVVDDGSTDGTYDIIKKIGGIRVLKHEANRGKGVALRTGIEHSKGSIIATIDADDTYPPRCIPQLVEGIENGYDMVIGSRFLGAANAMPKIRRLGNVFFSGLISVLTGVKITDASSGMRAFRKSILKRFVIKSRNLSWEVEMTTKALKSGFGVAEVPITYSKRIGNSKLSVFKDGFSFLSTILLSVIYATER